MIQKLRCLLGFHDWYHKLYVKNNALIYTRQCTCCGKFEKIDDYEN